MLRERLCIFYFVLFIFFVQCRDVASISEVAAAARAERRDDAA